jgi:recombination protein RecR
VGPSDLTIKELVSRVVELQGTGENNALATSPIEVIQTLSGDVEGETTSFYIYRQLSQYDVKVSALARGLGFGDDLEYADELTLGRSIVNRQPFKV